MTSYNTVTPFIQARWAPESLRPGPEVSARECPLGDWCPGLKTQKCHRPHEGHPREASQLICEVLKKMQVPALSPCPYGYACVQGRACGRPHPCPSLSLEGTCSRCRDTGGFHGRFV